MRAYSILQITKAADEAGTIYGIATTPETDRAGDVIEPLGAEFKLPLPFLWQHDREAPIGHVTGATATPRGISIVAKVSLGVTERIDEIFRLIKSGLVRGLSIGFRSIGQPERIETGLRFKRWELLELSAVTIPANAGASIQAVKAAARRVDLRRGDAIPLVRAGIPLLRDPR